MVNGNNGNQKKQPGNHALTDTNNYMVAKKKNKHSKSKDKKRKQHASLPQTTTTTATTTVPTVNALNIPVAAGTMAPHRPAVLASTGSTKISFVPGNETTASFFTQKGLSATQVLCIDASSTTLAWLAHHLVQLIAHHGHYSDNTLSGYIVRIKGGKESPVALQHVQWSATVHTNNKDDTIADCTGPAQDEGAIKIQDILLILGDTSLVYSIEALPHRSTTLAILNAGDSSKKPVDGVTTPTAHHKDGSKKIDGSNPKILLRKAIQKYLTAEKMPSQRPSTSGEKHAATERDPTATAATIPNGAGNKNTDADDATFAQPARQTRHAQAIDANKESTGPLSVTAEQQQPQEQQHHASLVRLLTGDDDSLMEFERTLVNNGSDKAQTAATAVSDVAHQPAATAIPTASLQDTMVLKGNQSKNRKRITATKIKDITPRAPPLAANVAPAPTVLPQDLRNTATTALYQPQPLLNASQQQYQSFVHPGNFMMHLPANMAAYVSWQQQQQQPQVLQATPASGTKGAPAPATVPENGNDAVEKVDPLLQCGSTTLFRMLGGPISDVSLLEIAKQTKKTFNEGDTTNNRRKVVVADRQHHEDATLLIKKSIKHTKDRGTVESASKAAATTSTISRKRTTRDDENGNLGSRKSKRIASKAAMEQQHLNTAGEIEHRTPAYKGKRPGSTLDTTNGGDSVIKLPFENWTCLSPPTNFQLPDDFYATTMDGNGAGSPTAPSWLGFYNEVGCGIAGNDQHQPTKAGSAKGPAANVMQNAVDALFQQHVNPPQAAPADGRTSKKTSGTSRPSSAVRRERVGGDASRLTALNLNSIFDGNSTFASLLMDGKSNSNWLASFETTVTNGGGENTGSMLSNRPFAGLFGPSN